MVDEYHERKANATSKVSLLNDVLADHTVRKLECDKISALLNPKKFEITKTISGTVVDKRDDVVQLMSTLQRARSKKMQNEDTLAKLIKRIDLDRPILAQEKMKFIMLEKKDDPDEGKD